MLTQYLLNLFDEVFRIIQAFGEQINWTLWVCQYHSFEIKCMRIDTQVIETDKKRAVGRNYHLCSGFNFGFTIKP